MKNVLSIFAVAVAMFLVSCGGSSSPSDAAIDVYQMLVDGKYDVVAENIYYDTDDAEELAQSKAMITSLLKEKVAPQLVAKGGIKSVEKVSETIAEDAESAVVELKIVYGDGTEETEKANMKLDDGKWKLAMNK